MADLTDEEKRKIDEVDEDELRAEVLKGRDSRYQRKKYDYAAARVDRLNRETQSKHNQTTTSIGKSNYWIALGAFVVAILGLVYVVWFSS
ncbi:MAG: hypothetical protein O7G86_08935 [Gammaproteobacteria bacterium]|nr:hypothetical protein [Gammaproteobacteria bacterium]